MQKVPPEAVAPAVDARPTRFVIPDLCNGAALGVAVLVGELLVVVLLFGGGELTWEGLALKSLYVQWIVLMSAGALCWTRPWVAQLSLAQGALFAFATITLITLLVSIGADRVVAGTASFRAVPPDWATIVSIFSARGRIRKLPVTNVESQPRIPRSIHRCAKPQSIQAAMTPNTTTANDENINDTGAADGQRPTVQQA